MIVSPVLTCIRSLSRQTDFKRYSAYCLAHATQKTGCSGVSAAQLSDTTTDQESPAVQSALATLSWPALCEFVARFASTTMGRQAAQRLPLSENQEQSEALVKETSAVDKMESEYAAELDFGGTSTFQVLLALTLQYIASAHPMLWRVTAALSFCHITVQTQCACLVIMRQTQYLASFTT